MSSKNDTMFIDFELSVACVGGTSNGLDLIGIWFDGMLAMLVDLSRKSYKNLVGLIIP